MVWNSATNDMEEAMWRLSLQSQEGKVLYPQRAGEKDCSYFLQTGFCGFGARCRFNHPYSVTSTNTVQYPQRPGEQECEYFLKTGMCKFGSACKYHHPQYQSARPDLPQLNIFGLPLRLDEKDCVYYLKTGQCKYGITCKFNHPMSGSLQGNVPGNVFHSPLPSLPSPGPQPYMGGVATLSVPRSPVIANPYFQGASGYLPVMLPQGVLPVPGWSPISPSAQLSPMTSDGRQLAGTGLFYGPQFPKDGANALIQGQYPVYYSPSASLGNISTNMQEEEIYPERPGHPECQFYMRKGYCKFGSTCKYHHPRERDILYNAALNPLGLPLRQGAQTCPFYSRQGFCKYGPNCRYDHPIGTLSYSPSSSSLSEMPVAPLPVTSSTVQETSSLSSAELSKGLIGTKEVPVLLTTSQRMDSQTCSSTEESVINTTSSEGGKTSVDKMSSKDTASTNGVSKEGILES